ncbi:hypothetical protein TcasGA2_TC014059 [Tribolium castaneum]|uniref:Uncharacterized protein n=1 Tax=Tribolium castaneum TaxID=7070 RepID=D6WJZ6_TRICA|nr:hypothetical protein TcasGA2_TC014059 [Tribolium castaneum]
MNVPITHDITSGSQRMYMHECCIANVTVDRTPALQPEVRLMHPQSTGDQLPYQRATKISAECSVLAQREATNGMEPNNKNQRAVLKLSWQHCDMC